MGQSVLGGGRGCAVCFARFKGLLKVQFPLKNVLPPAQLLRLRNWISLAPGPAGLAHTCCLKTQNL